MVLHYSASSLVLLAASIITDKHKDTQKDYSVPLAHTSRVNYCSLMNDVLKHCVNALNVVRLEVHGSSIRKKI